MAKIIGNAGNIALCTPKTTEAIIKLWDKHVIQGKGWDSDSLALVINAASYSITSILAAKNLGETFGNIRGELTDIVTSQCFIAGTLVLTEDGEKPIEEIEVGDYVYASDPETGESGFKEVLWTYQRETYELVHVFVADEEILTTPNHPFWVESEWIAAGNLHTGDILTLADGSKAAICQIFTESLDNPVKVYNFEVEDFHTYYVTDIGVLVHNYQKGTSNKNNERIYNPSPKHDPKSGWGSPNPIPSIEKGQELLDSAYSSSKNKQLYNILDGELIKFQPDTVSGWHSYLVENPAKEVPVDVLRQMVSDGKITKTSIRIF